VPTARTVIHKKMTHNNVATWQLEDEGEVEELGSYTNWEHEY